MRPSKPCNDEMCGADPSTVLVWFAGGDFYPAAIAVPEEPSRLLLQNLTHPQLQEWSPADIREYRGADCVKNVIYIYIYRYYFLFIFKFWGFTCARLLFFVPIHQCDVPFLVWGKEMQMKRWLVTEQTAVLHTGCWAQAASTLPTVQVKLSSLPFLALSRQLLNHELLCTNCNERSSNLLNVLPCLTLNVSFVRACWGWERCPRGHNLLGQMSVSCSGGN